MNDFLEFTIFSGWFWAGAFAMAWFQAKYKVTRR